jgi:uncharacterized NAD-dependent epimerase/dehydratase family protein
VINLPRPYLLFLGDATERSVAKTALGLADWAPSACLGEYALPNCTVSTGLPRMTIAQARSMGAASLVIGVANRGGVIPDHWIDTLIEALDGGLDLVSGMHARLASFPRLLASATRNGRQLIDVRIPHANSVVAAGCKRSGKRLLTVGTDCALGKKYTALAISEGFSARGLATTFRATGQTGIMIAGSGIAMDCIAADFLSGAAEVLSPDAAPDHWDVIEGQGSLFQPSYAAVSLGLLHGSQPDVFVVCHAAGRTHLLGMPEFTLPTVTQVIAQTIALGALTNPAIRCGGISLNTAALDEVSAFLAMQQLSDELGLAVADPMRRGPAFERLLDACLA